jgi:SMC interacting uncharacterized protein involved in chromosome segregation
MEKERNDKMLRPNSYINKERIIKLIQDKIDEGYEIIEKTTLENKEIGRMFMDMFELDKTLDQIEQEDNFDKEMSQKDKDEIQKALSKNKGVDINE